MIVELDQDLHREVSDLSYGKRRLLAGAEANRDDLLPRPSALVQVEVADLGHVARLQRQAEAAEPRDLRPDDP